MKKFTGMLLAVLLAFSFSSTFAAPDPDPNVGPEAFEATAPDAPVELLLISPEVGEQLLADEVLVAISLLDPNSAVDLSTIRLTLDNVDITERANVNTNLISYSPSQVMYGNHEIRLEMKTISGGQISGGPWTFNVIQESEAAEDVVSFNGRMDATYLQNDVSGFTTNINTGSLTFDGRYNFLSYDARVFLSSQEDPNAQAVNEYNLNFTLQSPGGTFMNKTQIGDHYPIYYSQAMGGGTRVRGFSNNFEFWKMGIQLTSGELLRAIDGETGNDTTTEKVFNSNLGALVDSQIVKTNQTVIPSVFTRKLNAFKLTMGRGGLGRTEISFISVRDDTGSVGISNRNMGVDNPNGPKDNIVLGFEQFQAYRNNRNTSLRIGAALSWLNTNIYDSALTKEKIADDFGFNSPVDPAGLSDVFIINGNMEPFLPGLDNLAAFAAFKTRFGIPGGSNEINVRGDYIGGSFNSLAASFVDRKAGVSFQDRLMLLNNQLFVTGGVDWYKAQSTGSEGDQRTGYNLMVNYFPVAMPFTIGMNARNQDVNSVVIKDSTSTATMLTRNQMTGANFSYRFNTGEYSHNIRTSYYMNNQNIEASDTDIKNDGISVGVDTEWEIPINTSLTFYTNGFNTKTASITNLVNDRNEIEGMVDYKLFNRKVKISHGIKHSMVSTEVPQTGSTTLKSESYSDDFLQTRVVWDIHSMHRLSGNGHYTIKGGEDEVGKDLSAESQLFVNYEFRF